MSTPSASQAWTAAALAVALVPVARYLAEHEDFFVSFLKWPVLAVAIAAWGYAARRSPRWEAAAKVAAGFYLILGLTFIFVTR